MNKLLESIPLEEKIAFVKRHYPIKFGSVVRIDQVVMAFMVGEFNGSSQRVNEACAKFLADNQALEVMP